MVGTLVEACSDLWVGEVFGGEVEGVEVPCGGRAEPRSGVVLLRCRVVAERGEASRPKICSSSSVAVRRRRLSGWITACGFPSPTTET